MSAGRWRNIWWLGLLLAVAPGAQAQLDRDWKIFVVPFSHVDVGFTAPVETVVEQHSTYLDSVVAYVERYKSNPADARFRWSTEVSWQLENYLATRTPQQIDRFMQLVREGYIDLNAMYLSVQTDLCGPEELARLLYYSEQIAQEHHVFVGPAVTNDTPGFTWGLAQLLARAEVPYFSLAMNSALSDFYTTTDLPNLFYWEAQSGHRTLVWRSIHKQLAYLEGSVWGVYSSYSLMESRITNLLNQLANDGYPYDFVLINAATGDNGAPNPSIVNNVQQWNDLHSGSRMRVATFSDFFQHAGSDPDVRASIPVISGDAPNWWSLWFASSASRGHLTSRKAQALLPAAETAASIASVLDPSFDYPAEDLDRAYNDNLLYEDHNMGAAGNRPPAENGEFWELKMGWVMNALTTAQDVFEVAIDAWAGQIETRNALQIAVFNTLPWTRSEVVRLPVDHPLLAEVRAFELVDNKTNQPVAHQRLSTGEFAFLADSVPALGYRTFRIAEHTGPIQGPTPLSGNVLDNGLYRIELGETGGAVSIYDYELDREWAVGNEQMNQYRWSGSGVPMLAATASDSGEVLQRILLRGDAPGSDSYQTEVILPAGQKRVDFYDIWDKLPPISQETVDFFFDFDAPGSELRYEIPFGHVRLFDDELSGFNMKHYESQRWSTISDETATAILSSSGPGLHAYPGGFNGRVRFLTSWDGAGSYRAGTGLLDAGFSLTSHEGGPDPSAATQAGYSFSVPLEPRILPRNQSGSLTPAAYSFIDVQGGTLQLSTLKQWQFGDGLIGRFYNPSPEPVDVDFVFSGIEPYVYEADLLERIVVAVKRGSRVGVHFDPYDVKTLVLGVRIVGADESDQPQVAGAELVDAYPNPFVESVTLRYTTNEPMTRARLTVHDVLGRTIATLSDDRVATGTHEFSWDGRDVGGREAAAGVYIVSFETMPISGERRRTSTTVIKAR